MQQKVTKILSKWKKRKREDNTVTRAKLVGVKGLNFDTSKS